MPGISWGQHNVLYTPAFWRHQAELVSAESQPSCHKLGSTYIEEIAACLLGGHGIPAEVGLAAFYRVRERGLLQLPFASEVTLSRTLREPLNIRGKQIRYRFAQQKASYLARTFEILAREAPPTTSGIAMRNWLLRLPGVGLKTASWIARNWLDADDIAIIDIHIHRAGILAGFFSIDSIVARDYVTMETKFLEFSQCLGVRASLLDALMWRHMRDSNGIAIRTLRTKMEQELSSGVRKVA